MKFMLDLFKISLTAQKVYLAADIQNKKNRKQFEQTVDNILAVIAIDPNITPYNLHLVISQWEKHALRNVKWTHLDHLLKINKDKYIRIGYFIAKDLARSLHTRFVSGGHNNTAERVLSKRKVL